MNKKKIRAIILIVWAVLCVALVAAILLTNPLGLSRAVIKVLVIIYTVLSVVMAGVVFWLSYK